MNDLFEGFEGVRPVEAASDPFADFEGVTHGDQAAPAVGDPVFAFRAKLADPKEYARIKRWAAYHGTTPEDPIVQQRLTNPLNFPTYSTLLQLKMTGNLDEVNDMTPEGNAAGTGLRAALMQFGHAGGVLRRRNDAIVSRIAAGQELEVGDTRDITAQIATGMAGVPRPNLRIFKKIEDMTRAEQDATVPKEIIDLVNQYDSPEAPLDARTRAEAIYTAAKSSATAREQTMEMAALELALREELTGKTGGFLERAGVLAAKGMPTVGHGNTFLTLTPYGAAVVSGMDKTTELLSADINPDTGEVEKQGTDYDDARLRGYAYGAFEAATEVLTSKILGAVFKGADKLLTGGRIRKGMSKGYDALARKVSKSRIGMGIAEFAKGVQRIATLSATNNPFTEILGEEGIQQWGDAVFAQRPSDTETPVYVKNVFNEATGEMEQMQVEPGSDEERTAKRMLTRYGEKSGYAEAGTRQMTVGEKTKEFLWGDGVNKGFVSWENLTALAEGFALQYLLTLGGGAMHAVQTKEGRRVIDTYLMAAGHTNADLIRMSDEQKAEAFDAFYGAEANREEFAKVFKDAGEMLSLSAQRVVDSELFMRTGAAIKPNFKTDIVKGVEGGAATLDDDASGFSVDYTSTLEGTAFTVRDRDGVLSPMTFNTAEEAQKGAEKMSQLKQGRQLHMEKRAEIATRVAQVFAPGRNVILVHTDKDMKAAAVAEGADAAQYKSGAPGLTTPNGTIVLNVAAITSFDDLVYNVKHETGHSVADEAGLTKLMAGKTVNWIAAEFQKAGIIAPGENEREKFVKAVESVRADYAARGVKLADADAVAEVLSMQQEGMTPVFRKKFGDGLVTLLRGKDKSAKNMRDVRRAVAAIMYSGREAKVDLFGGKDAWKAPAPAFEGDPIAAAGAETGEKEAVEPAEEAAPEAMPAQGEEAPGAEGVAPDAESAVKPPATKSPEAEAAAKDIKAAFEEKQKAKAPVEEAAPVETPPEAPKAEAPKAEPPAPATPVAKKIFTSEEEMLEYVAAHQEETENWTEESFEIVPAPAPAKSDGAPIVPTSDAGQGEAEKPKETHSEQKERPRLHSLEWFIGTGMSPEAAQKAYEGERGQGKTEVVSPKPTYLSLGDSSFSKAMMGESMGGNAGPNRIALNFLHDGEGVVFWGNFQESKPEIRKRYDAGELKDGTLLLEFAEGDFSHPKVVDVFGELPPTLANVKDTIIDLTRPSAPTPTVTLEGGTPAEIESEKAKVEAQRKKQEERDEIAKKAAAPLKGDLGDSTPPLPGMEGVAPDDLELLNQKPKEAQNADQERGAEEVAGGEQAGGAEKDGGGDAQGSEAAGQVGKSEGEGLQERAVEVEPQVAKMSAEVTFESVPKKGQYAEIPGVSTAQGKRMYLIQGKWGDGNTFHVSPTHHGIVLTGMGVLLRTKGQPSAHSGVRIVGGGKAPAGSEKWGVAEWATHNQKLSNRHKEGAKPTAPTASDSAPTGEAKPVEAPKIEAPKAEPPVPAPKMKFASEEEMMRYVSAHPELNWTGDEFEIVPDEKGEAAPEAPQAEQEAAPAVAQFEPPKIKYGENTGAYRRRVAAAKAEWDKEQAAVKIEQPSVPAQGAKTPAVGHGGGEKAKPFEKHPGYTMVAAGVTPEDFDATLRAFVDRRAMAVGASEGTTIRRIKVVKGDDAWLKYTNPAVNVLYDNLNLYVPVEQVETWNDVALAQNKRDLVLKPVEAKAPTDAKDAEEEAEAKAKRANLEAQRDLLLDIMETRRMQGQDSDPGHRRKLAELDALLKGEPVEAGAIASERVFGHPEATNIGGGKYSNLLPIRVADRDSVERFRVRAQKALDEVQSKLSTAEAITKGRIKGNKKQAQAYLSSQNAVEDSTVRDLLRSETLPELRRLHDALPPSSPTAPTTPPYRDGADTQAAPDAKDAEEIAELQANAETQARVNAIPDAEYAAAPALAVMDVELPAYEARKAAATRTADSKERQAYSTPPPLAAIGAAALASARGDNADAVTVIEPTAGNGGLIAVLGLSEGDKVLANELDEGRAKRLGELFLDATVTQGDYAAEAYQQSVRDAAKDGPRAFLMNPPFGPADESGYKLEHKIALKTIESAVPGDTLFFIGAAPGRNAMKMSTGALAGVYTSGPFAKFHQELNRRGWKATLHFIADGGLYRKMGASFPVEVLLMEKTDGSEMNPHMPMRDLPARYSTWEQIRAAVAEMYDPGAETLGERVANDLNLSGKAEQARAEAQGNAEASSAEVNAARVKEGAAGTIRYRLSQDIELGLVTPETGLTLNPFMMKINGKVWDKEFAGKVRNPDQLARHILSLPAEIAEARIKVADAIAKHLAANPANGFITGTGFNSMGPALREAFEARWNAARTTDMDAEEDKAQIEYFPLSAVKVASPMKVPRELAGGMATALSSFDERHPEGIDAFVAEKMRRPMTEKELDGSQIDTLGLALEKIDEGTGFIVGSQTGAGKGRVMASVMDYHILNGRVPIFLTAQAKLFTDIWRDITAIGAQDRFKPLVMNDYKTPKNEDPDSEDADAFSMPLFFTPVRRNSALSEGKLPQGANAIFLTYSQVQNPTANTRRKIDLIKKLLASGKGALVMDEAHLAAGADSNRGAVLREFADLAKSGVVFSSATFAKRGENMTLYKRAGYSQFFKNDEDMEKALMVGGVPFQQYLAARLTERGFYVRHELDYEGVVFEKLTTIDTLGTPQERTALSQREEQIADVYNQVVRTVMRFGGMVKAVNSRLQKGAPSANMDGAAFMSSLHNTASFIYTALKAETVANAAVAELRAGRAPVVTLYNTNQALLTEIGLNQSADVGRYLTRISERAVSIQMPDGSSASILTPAGFDRLVQLVKAQEATMLRDAADALVRQARSAAEYLREQNLPASPIDRVREIVQNAGYQFGEVTGRTVMVQNGVVVRRVKPNPDTVIRQFNQGAPDGSPNMVLLLNSSGSTGLSAHASSDFRNQARRVMFVLQPSWDINEMMQMFGRVNRKNQLSKPIYHLVFTSAAGEQRNAAILMSKLRSLSANTSGVSKAGYGEEVEDALDFMNAFGDKALAELAKERNPVVASINSLRASTSIRSATSISQFLPVREQEEFIGQIQAKVAALQDNAREAGLHDLEAGDIGRVPLTVEQLLSNSAMRAYEVPVLGRGKILTASEAVAAAQAWREKHPTMLDDAKVKIDKAIAGTSNPWLKRIYGDTAQVLEHALDSIGQVYYVRDDVGGGRRWFVPIEAHLPPSGTAQTASDWRVKVSFNTIRGVTTIPLSIFSDKILSNAAKSSERNYNETLTRKEDRTIIAGDVAQALIGNIVATGASGASQIVRALPVDGNFSSFVLMMPRGITVANAKKIASSRLEKVTDVMNIRVGQGGYLGIDADRVKVTPTYSSTTGDQIGAVFAFRMATPNKSRSKDVTVAQLMRAAGAESRLRDTPNSQGYVTGPYLGVDEANTALKNLATLHPALQATQIVSDEAKVGGQDVATRNAPRFKLPGVKLEAAAEPVFFSQLRRTLEAKMPNRMTVMALRGLIDPSRSGVKADEIEWTGLKDFLDSKNPGDYVTKAEVLEATKDVEIQEVVKGQTQAELESQEELTALARLGRDRTPEQDARYEQLARRLRIGKDLDNATKFEQYQLPGGENYRELLLTLPNRERYYLVIEKGYWWVFDNNKGRTVGKGYDYESEAKQHLAEYYQDVPVGEQYRSSHWEEPNVLAHVRFNERQAANGDKTLFLEEVQSDWHQAGREKGYASTEIDVKDDMAKRYFGKGYAELSTEDKSVVDETYKKPEMRGKRADGVPDAPFKDTSKGWARLAFKRMLRWAAENSFDRIAWTTGEQQAERYDLSKHISMASAISNGDGTYNLIIEDMRGDEVAPYSRSGKKLTPAEMEDTIGKDLAAKLIEGADRNKGKPWPKSAPSNPAFFTLRGLDLKVGGEGMRTFYDQILPSIANDLGKKFGARVEDIGIGDWGMVRNAKGPREYATELFGRDLWTLNEEESRVVTEAWKANQIKGLPSVHSLPVTPAMRDSVMQGQPRFKLPGVTLDDDISAPVRVGELRTQTQLENDDPVGFPILDHIRGGSPIIIPRDAIGRKGEYDWFTEAGGLKAFNLAEQKAFFRYPKAALGEKKSRGNIDELAKELEPQLGTDDVETFANAFMAEVERSRALYRVQKERQAVRRDALETFSESPHLAGMKNIGENLGKAVGSVYDSLQGEEKATLEMIYDREGTDAVRDYILRQHIDLVALDMIERHAFQMEVESGARDEAPPIIQDRGTLAIDTPVNEKGDTRPVFDQTKESLDVKRARLYAQALQGVPTITDEAAAAHVREALDVGGKIFLRDIAQRLTAERLTGATTRPLDKLQTAIMLWYQTDLDERAKDSDRQAQAAVEAHDLNNLNAVDMMRDSLNRETIDYLNAARQYGSLAGQALQALKLRVDHAFNIVKIYRQARENIGRDLTRAEFEKLKARIDILEKKWNDYVDAVTLPDEQAKLDARVAELEKKLADITAARAAVKTEADGLEAKKAALEAEYAKQSGTMTELSEKKARLEAQIATLENEIAMREALNQEVGELHAKVDALQAKLDALDAEYAGASPELLASLEKQLADLTKLHAEKLAAYHKADEDLKTANERLKRVRKLIEKLGKGTKAKIVRRRAVLENAANLYGEFKAEMERAQVEQLKARWRSAPLPKKALIAFEGVENIIQGLQSMADESVAGRQLIKLFRSHPIMWARAFAQSQHIVFHKSGMTDDTGRTLTWQERSDRYYYELDQAQREDPLFDILVRKGGLDWMDITADPTSFDEQQIPIGPLLNNMLPSKATRFVTSVLGVSNNHYAGMSNMLRFAVAKLLYNQMSVAKGETPNEDDIYAIVSTVDIFGSRGDMSTKTARAVIDFGRHLLYSPRLALANAQYYRRMFGMLANPRYSRQARKMILMQYVQSGITYATLSFIARVLSWLLYDDKDQQRFQFRSGHTAYTQFMFGQQRVDITGGQATWDRAAMNFLGGGLIDLLPEWAQSVVSVIDNGDKLATETGLVITEQYKREKGDYDTLGRFARSKLKPLTGMFLDAARGKNYEGQAAGPRAQPHQPGYDRRHLNLLRSIAPVPLSLQTAGDLYMGDPDQGINPVHNPFLFVSWMTMESLGMLARSLPINAELAQQVAEGYTKKAEELENLKRQQRDIMNDRKMSPEMKELKAGRIQNKLDRLRGM